SSGGKEPTDFAGGLKAMPYHEASWSRVQWFFERKKVGEHFGPCARLISGVAMTPNPMNRDRFLRNVKQSGLVPTRDFRRLIDRLADERKPRALARTLVDWGLVTKFQA